MGNKIKFALAVITLAAMFLAFNCTPDSLKGVLIDNTPPTIYFTNLPLADSVYSSSALISWYSSDDDGIVTAYYHKVVLVDSMPGTPEEYVSILNDTSLVSLSEWNATPPETTDVLVRLFADTSETDTLRQYIYVKCQDNRGDFSETIFMNVFRTNHVPETYLDLLPGNYIDSLGDSTIKVLPVWSNEEVTPLWTGFSFSWEGEDTLDFPFDAPDFQYEWKLYGPFDTTYYDGDNDTVLISLDDVVIDDLYAQSCADNDDGYIFSTDTLTCEDPWVWDKRMTWVGLPTGCYLFSVRVRDDANVPDPTYAWGTFVCIIPGWIEDPENTKDILVVQATQWKPPTYPLRGFPYDTNGDSSAYYPDSVQNFYIEMIESAGFTSNDYDIYGDPVIFPNSETDYPTIEVLAKYRMIIFDDMDYDGIELADEFSHPFIPVLRDYLSIGGKAWVIGRQSFSSLGAMDYGPSNFPANTIAVDFFDLSSANYPRPNFQGTLGEFLAATSTYSTYDDLTIDSLRTEQMGQYGINKVEVLARNSVYSRTLFTYHAAQPDTMTDFEYLPCAVRYAPEHGIFKTSYFSFPLYMMDNSNGEVQEIFTDMLDWFLPEEN